MRISIQLKSATLRLLCFALKSVVVFWRLATSLLRYIAIPLRILLRFTFDALLVTLYRLYLMVKMRVAVWWLPAKNRALFPLSTKYMTHAFLVVTTLFVTAHSLKAHEVRQSSFANPSILSSLLRQNDAEEIVDAASIAAPASTRYLQGIGGISALDAYEGSATEDELVTAQGSSSLVKPEVAGTDAIGAERKDVLYHVVEGGETISDIAQRYAISVNTVLWENELSPRDYIKPGQKLTILPASGVSHRVERGDTVSKLAQKYDTRPDDILSYNKLADASAIQEGDVLLIPGGREPEPVAPIRRATPSGSRYAALIDGNPPASLDVTNDGGFLWPTPSHKMNQYFSYRHIGVDIDGDYSSPIYASKSGRVIFAGWGRGYGLHVIVDHGNGVSTLYGHASKVFVKEGSYVKRGQSIAMVGSTGYSTGTHLHFEIRKGPGLHPKRLNPLQYL
ncbi:MAG: M23 family metallopeptidase [Candidatus Kerfeldbacteria bacterium]|nr:M23 family metallopeptidase [Candidatus Kerfeldbacteria bacterium]